ncbi:alpha/beta hydrolase [Candidatus Dojkabacteria bacterium]|uniref:Alpha/beta hydrolase n=1 Tax=Candidatus Dojkabacteria bacterium TaxID=2099670 RepID=A0A955L7W4_9BACT|nr:alpha/beta hydrolase [Candidatus Dojkabacteria bacterium]
MKTSLIEFTTTDDLTLPGLLYEPPKNTKKIIIWLHGCGSTSIFYSVERMNTLAHVFENNDIAFLAFNNRGAHIAKSLYRHKGSFDEERIMMGTAYEKINDSLHDIEGAIAYAQSIGYEEIYLAGHSSGANKICTYNTLVSNSPVLGYILVGSGDDVGIYYSILGKKGFESARKKAKTQIESGNGEKLVPKYMYDGIYTYQGFYDITDPDGHYNTFPFTEYFENLNLSKTQPLFNDFKKITKPTLVLYGSLEEWVYKSPEDAIAVMKKFSNNAKNFSYEIVNDADHGFSGKSKELGNALVSWLLKN